MKRLVLFSLLVLSAALHAQNYMPSRAAAASIKNAGTTGAGIAYMVDTNRGDFSVAHTVAVTVTSQPTALTVDIEGSLDGANYFPLAIIDAADSQWISGVGEMVHIANKAVLYIRCNIVTYTPNGSTASCLLLSGGI